MKKLLLIIMTILTICTNVHAEDRTDGQMALLRTTNHTEAFYGPDALLKAYDVAVELSVQLEDEFWAIVTLSPGYFYSPDTISIPITIVGSYGIGYNGDTFVNDVTPIFLRDDNSHTTLDGTTISADNVTLEGIFFQKEDVNIGKVNNCHFKRCMIQSLKAVNDHTNTQIDECVVINDGGIMRSTNYRINNTTICKFKGVNSNKATITNCFIYFLKKVPNDASTYVPYATYANNILGVYIKNDEDENNRHITITGNSEYNNNLFCYHNGYYGTLGYYDYWDYNPETGEEIDEPGYSINFTCPNSGNQMYVVEEGCYFGPQFPNLGMDIISFSSMDPEGSIIGTDGTPVGVSGGNGFFSHPNIPRVKSSSIDKIADTEGKIKINITRMTTDPYNDPDYLKHQQPNQ